MSKSSDYIRACRRIENAINAATGEGAGSHKRRTAMLRELAEWATTFYSIESYERISTLRLPWKAWERELYRASRLVAAAIRLVALDGLTKARAIGFVNVPPADYDEAIRLLSLAGLSINDIASRQSPDIKNDLAAVRERLHVHLEPRALEDVLLAAAEGYKVSPGKGSRFTEVFGLCFGSVRRAHRKDHSNVMVNVSRIATQLRARATSNSVFPNAKSLAAQLQVGQAFFPHLDIVGDYHTHPYRSLAELRRNEGWGYSTADAKSVPDFLDDLRRHDRDATHFSLVVAVAEGGKSGAGTIRKAPNVVQISIRDLFFVIGAYRIQLDATYDDEVQLKLSAAVP